MPCSVITAQILRERATRGTAAILSFTPTLGGEHGVLQTIADDAGGHERSRWRATSLSEMGRFIAAEHEGRDGATGAALGMQVGSRDAGHIWNYRSEDGRTAYYNGQEKDRDSPAFLRLFLLAEGISLKSFRRHCLDLIWTESAKLKQ